MKRLTLLSVLCAVFASSAMAMPGFIRCKEDTSASIKTVHTFSFKARENSKIKTVTITIDSVPNDSTQPTKRKFEFVSQGTEDTLNSDILNLDTAGFIRFDKEAQEVSYELPGKSEVVVKACKVYRPSGGTGN